MSRVFWWKVNSFEANPVLTNHMEQISSDGINDQQVRQSSTQGLARSVPGLVVGGLHEL